MTSTRWLASTLGLLLLLALASAAVAWRMDVFGIFRDPRGRALVTSGHERRAKYLLNQAYVPANFDALIIGASASVNWHPDLLTGHRFYNESLEGGNATEERLLVEAALPQAHFQLALVGLYPRITTLHDLQDFPVGFDQATRAEALGSLSAYSVEYAVLRDRLLHRTSAFTPDGSHSFPPHAPVQPNQQWHEAIMPDQDPLAVEDYRALVQQLLDRHTRVVYVVYPIFEEALLQNRQEIDEYMASVRKSMPPAPMIDFNAPQFLTFRSDNRNFIDLIHLSPTGAETLSRMIDQQLAIR